MTVAISDALLPELMSGEVGWSGAHISQKEQTQWR